MEKIPEINIEITRSEIKPKRDMLRSSWKFEGGGMSLEIGDAALEEMGLDPENFEMGYFGRIIPNFEELGYSKEVIKRYSELEINKEYY